jgi:collagenase-like PrtC family protease
MEIRVSTNWDPHLPAMLKDFPVTHVYGKLADDVVGGCRPSFLLPQVSRQQIADHVALLHGQGIKFSYLLNTLSLANVQYTKEGYRQIRELLDWLTEIKVDALTIAIPYLIRLVKEHYPHFFIKVSSVSRINTVTRARQYEDMGVDELIIDEMLNRDFETLKAINDSVKTPLEVIANPCCLWECAQQFEHVNHDGHASQSHSHNNYCYLQLPYVICSSQKLEDPVNILKARWIRPEDLHYYEEIGISRFKVVERFKTSGALTMAVKAYSDRSFDGNLIDLLTLPNKGSFLPPNLAYFNKPDMVDMEQVQAVAGLMNFSFNDAITIPNKALDGFLKHFKTHDCRRLSCDDCGYCQKFFDKVAIYNKDVAMTQANNLKNFAKVITDGRIFGSE